MATSTLTKHLMEIKEDLYKSVEEEIANDTSGPKIDMEKLDTETKMVVFNMYSQQQAQMHSLRMSTLRTWTKVIDSLIAVSTATDKLEDKIAVPWYKDARTLGLGFVMFVLILVMVFRLFEINPTAAAGTTNFGSKIIDGASDITRSVTNNGSKTENKGNSNNYNHDYGYGPGTGKAP